MTRHASNDPHSDAEDSLDELFRVREMAPADFAERTLAAVRAKRRRMKVLRFTAWSTSLAACMALLLGLGMWRSAADQPGLTATVSPALESPAQLQSAAEGELADLPQQPTTAEELTAALYAAFSQDDVIFYAQARTLESLLTEAVALSEEENELTLDYLIVLAHH